MDVICETTNEKETSIKVKQEYNPIMEEDKPAIIESINLAEKLVDEKSSEKNYLAIGLFAGEIIMLVLGIGLLIYILKK